MNQPILLYRSGSVYANETAAWAALDAVTHKKGQPIVAFYTLSSPVSGHHGSSTIGAIFAIGIGDGVGQYKACTSHDDMLIVAQSLNAHITQFNQMFEYDANHNAIKAKLDFYTTDGKSISAGGIGGGSSASLGALYQLVDVIANSSNTGVEGAVEGSVLAYDAKAGKWKAIAQSEILPDMSGYYTKDETDSAINTAKSNLQGQVDTLKALIPATASADNQLADKDFVNSSIATATAEFKGSFTSLDELKATSGNLNDYAFYLHTDNIGNRVVDRYKWTTAGWLYEYTLNNSSFTAEQWAALNSAITATLVQSYNSHLNNSTIHITAAERNTWNNKWDYDEEIIKAVKVNAAGSADYASSAGNAATADVVSKTYANQSINFTTGDSKIRLISNNDVNGGSNGFPAQYVGGISAISDYVGWQMMTDADNTVPNPFFRKVDGKNHWTTWKQLAFLTDNVASATKLATARKIWGRPFDGSADVSGDLTEVGNITASGKATIQGDIICGGEVVAITGEGTPAGVTDYSALTGKPSINGVTLVSGNNTLAALGIQAAGDYATNSGVTTLLANYAEKTFVSNNYVGKSAFNNHAADTNIHITSAERNAWNAKWDYNENTIKAVKVTSASSADSVAWSGITGKPTTFTPSAHTHTASDVSGLPTSLKNPYALTFGSKTYDGSAAATITASDLGALTAHQSIYAFTLQVNGTSQGVYNPASAAKTINIAVPTKTSEITNNSGFITSAAIPTALKNPYAVEIKANGVSLGTYDGSATATFNLSAANVGAANKVHSHTASEVSGLPTKLSAFTNDAGYITGITKSMVEGVLTGNITSHTHSYLPLSGGTIIGKGGALSIKRNSANNPSLIKFENTSGILGFLGFESANTPVFYNIDASAYYTLLHSGNYNSYAPTLTGTGASGTWGININGNAATATNASNADALDGYHADIMVKSYIDSTDNFTSFTNRAFFQTAWVSGQGDFCSLVIPTWNDNNTNAYYTTELRFELNSTNPKIRYTNPNGTSDWYTLARTVDNVASATKLQDNTAFTAWGQTFFENGKPKNVSGELRHLSMDRAEIYWNGDINGSYISSNGMNEMTYEMRDGHRFCVNGDIKLRITRFGNVLIGTAADRGYKLDVNGKTHITSDLIVDGEVSALVA